VPLLSGEVKLGRTLYYQSRSKLKNKRVMTHDLEAWTLAFLPDGSGMLSGGDDCALRFTELPQNPMDCYEDLVPPQYAPWRKSPWTDTKIHGAGVTAILPVYWDEANLLILTGSYDDHIRLINAQTTGRREVLAKLDLGGAVWSLKVLAKTTVQRTRCRWHTWDCDPYPKQMLLLVSCMHVGARIMKLACIEGTWRFEVLAKFEEHKSMTYGSDSQPDPDEQGRRTFISTSFYDRLLCLWRY
jgi:diphthamide biosynthesis protein 7